MSTRKYEDASLLLTVAPLKYCPRRLQKGMVKRYMSKGPLAGYMIGCPSCGFIELHHHDKVGFVEVDGQLVRTERTARCMFCSRKISITTEEMGVVIRAQEAQQSAV